MLVISSFYVSSLQKQFSQDILVGLRCSAGGGTGDRKTLFRSLTQKNQPKKGHGLPLPLIICSTLLHCQQETWQDGFSQIPYMTYSQPIGNSGYPCSCDTSTNQGYSNLAPPHSRHNNLASLHLPCKGC